MFTNVMNRGFHLELDNGIGVSVQWGRINYGSNRYKPDPTRPTMYASQTAEIAAWRGTTDLHLTSCSTYLPYVTADIVVKLLSRLSQLPSDAPASRLLEFYKELEDLEC
jgi:hypothetical protein